MPNTLGSGAGPSWPDELDAIETYEDGSPLLPDGTKRADAAFANDTFKTLQRLEQTMGVNPQGGEATVAARLGVIEATGRKAESHIVLILSATGGGF